MSLTFLQAFEQLLSRAPGPVFPRARELYLRKYALEQDDTSLFRTFLLEEEIQEASGGAVRSRAVAFAVVHWHAGQVEPEVYRHYLASQWQLHPEEITPVEGESWFRDGGAWARFTAAAVYERATPTTLVSPPVDRDGPGASDAPIR